MLKKDKKRNKVKVMESSIQSSVCVIEMLACLNSIKVKENVPCCYKCQLANRKRLSNIVPPVIIIRGQYSTNELDLIISTPKLNHLFYTVIGLL